MCVMCDVCVTGRKGGREGEREERMKGGGKGEREEGEVANWMISNLRGYN